MKGIMGKRILHYPGKLLGDMTIASSEVIQYGKNLPGIDYRTSQFRSREAWNLHVFENFHKIDTENIEVSIDAETGYANDFLFCFEPKKEDSLDVNPYSLIRDVFIISDIGEVLERLSGVMLSCLHSPDFSEPPGLYIKGDAQASPEFNSGPRTSCVFGQKNMESDNTPSSNIFSEPFCNSVCEFSTPSSPNSIEIPLRFGCEWIPMHKNLTIQIRTKSEFWTHFQSPRLAVRIESHSCALPPEDILVKQTQAYEMSMCNSGSLCTHHQFIVEHRPLIYLLIRIANKVPRRFEIRLNDILFATFEVEKIDNNDHFYILPLTKPELQEIYEIEHVQLNDVIVDSTSRIDRFDLFIHYHESPELIGKKVEIFIYARNFNILRYRGKFFI